MSANSGVYKIINNVNNKVYIGSSAYLNRRKREHFTNLKNNRHINRGLQKAFNRDGATNFLFDVLEFCNQSVCMEREQYYLDLYTPYNLDIGYNISIKANSQLGIKRSEETKRKQSFIKKGYKITEEHRQNIINALTGRIVSKETREKLSKIHTGRKMTKEQCLKISAANMGRKMSNELKEKLKIGQDKFNENHPDSIMVSQYNKDGVFIRNHKSINKAALFIGANATQVWRVIHGQSGTIKGFIFKLYRSVG